MIGLKRKVGRGAAPAFDPEFSSAKLGKPEPLMRARRTIRCLIYVHCLMAVLTATHQISHRFDIDHRGGDPFESITVSAFLTVFLLPPLTVVTAVRGQIPMREFCRVVLATLALSWFQFLAILPECQ